MSLENFLNENPFEVDEYERTDITPVMELMEKADLRGQVEVEDKVILFTSEEFTKFVSDKTEDDLEPFIISFAADKYKYVLLGDGICEGIDSDEDLENALDAWSVYL